MDELVAGAKPAPIRTSFIAIFNNSKQLSRHRPDSYLPTATPSNTLFKQTFFVSTFFQQIPPPLVENYKDNHAFFLIIFVKFFHIITPIIL